ncbi:hypothetical protein RSAG8_05139, partial [Rhizoctonia solani AG-8 WAC10335]
MTFLRSETHYFPRGDVVIQVEGILFKLHRDILETHSDFFRDMLSIPIGDSGEGTTDSHPLRLPLDLCSAKSFTMLCQFIYPMEVGKLPAVQVKDFNVWEPVLEATLALQMPSIQRYIMAGFEQDEQNIPLEAVGLLSWAMRCDAPLEALKFECFRTLAYRRQSLSQNEGMILGAKTATVVMRGYSPPQYLRNPECLPKVHIPADRQKPDNGPIRTRSSPKHPRPIGYFSDRLGGAVLLRVWAYARRDCGFSETSEA